MFDDLTTLYAMRNDPVSITQLKWDRNEKVDLPESSLTPQPTLIDTTRTIAGMGFCAFCERAAAAARLEMQ